MPIHRLRAALLTVILITPLARHAPAALAASLPQATPPPPSAPDPRNERNEGWRADIEALILGLARLHPALDHGTPRGTLLADAGHLAARVPTATDDEIMVGIVGLVSSVSAAGCDAHTGAYVWGSAGYPLHGLPLRLWWFDEGIYVVDALDPYRHLVGARIDSIARRPIAEVLATLDPLVPRDSATTVRLLMPRFLLTPQILRGAGLLGDGPPTFALTTVGGEPFEVAVDPIAMSAYNAWAGPYGLHLPRDPDTLYLSRTNETLWSQLIDPTTLYVQYNRVDYLPPGALEAVRRAANGAERVILDVRHNTGGEVPAIRQLVELFRDPAIDRPGRLFVITGRNTFSAASMFVARLIDATSAIVVGEPMGGCPNPYGNARSLTLPYSKLGVSVATTQEVAVSRDDARLTIEPVIPARLTPEAWLARQDPALTAIHSYQP